MLKVLIQNIPISTPLTPILYSIIQTQDIFSIRFQPEYSECDINIYEFKQYVDIRKQVAGRLKELRFNMQIKQDIVDNLDKNLKLIEENIKYGKEESNLEDVIAAAKKANATKKPKEFTNLKNVNSTPKRSLNA